MAFVAPFGFSTEQVRALLDPLRNDFSLAIYNCQNAFAVGAMIRVAHSFLPREIFIVGSDAYYEKASMGMHKFEKVRKLLDTTSFLAEINGRPLWSVEKDFANISLYDVEKIPKNVVIMVGSERAGLPKELIEKSDRVIGIPMYGVNHSLPVTVACGIVLSDWARHHYRPHD